MRILAILILGIYLASPPTLGQDCRDEDGDGALAGVSCAAANDCDDRDWERHPGAAEICNGFDDDCDGTVDEFCNRSCPDPQRFLLSRELELEAGLDSGNRTRVAFGRGRILAALEEGYTTTDIDRLRVRGFDIEARPLGPATHAEDQLPSEDLRDRDYVVVLAGDRALVVWSQLSATTPRRTLARVFDAIGTPLGAVLDLSATLDEPYSAKGISAIYDGERFVVYWTSDHPDIPEQRWLLATTIHRDGSWPEEPTRLVTTAESAFFQELRALWTGAHTVLLGVLSDGTRVGWTFTIDRQDQLLSSTPLTYDVHTSYSDIAWLGDRIAIAWGDPSESVPTARVAFLELDGSPYPDLPITLTAVGNEARFSADVSLAWTGEQLGVLLNNVAGQAAPIPSWYFWRILPDGSVLDVPGRTLGTRLGDALGLVWSGESFWLSVHDTDKHERHEIVCACQDADNDGFDTCVFADCDDSNANVNRLATEVCTGGLDENCNGLIDCDDPACTGSGGTPSPVVALRWENLQLVWDPVSGAERYDVARGLISDLRRRDDLLASECAGFELGAPGWADDGRRPPTGDALWYLARPEAAPCTFGTWGNIDLSRETSACR